MGTIFNGVIVNGVINANSVDSSLYAVNGSNGLLVNVGLGGSDNHLVGRNSHYPLIQSGASSNSAFGKVAFTSVTSGKGNVCIGKSAGKNISNADDNTLVGRHAGNTIVTGSGNVCVGERAQCNGSSNNQIVIGQDALGTVANSCVIGNDLLLHIRPSGTGTCDLGTNGNPFKDLYLNGDMYLSGRVVSQTQEQVTTATLNIDTSLYNMSILTAQTVNLTIANPTNALQGSRLTIRLTSQSGFVRALTWGSEFTSYGATIPSLTTVNKSMYIECIFSATTTKWHINHVFIEP